MIKMPGKTLCDIRKKLRMSQEQFAQLTGAHVQTLSKWERGIHPVPQVVAILATIIEDDPVACDRAEKLAGIK